MGNHGTLTIKDFTITCNKCNSKNVKINSDTGYTSDYDCLDEPATVSLICKDCKNYDNLYL